MSIGTTILEFTLTDVDGVPHEYVMRQHPTMQGLALIDKLIQAGLGTLLEALFSAVGLPSNMDSMGEEEQSALMLKTLAKLDRSKLVSQFLEGLARAGGVAALAPDLLTFTTRDGTPLKRAGFDAAYQGNYREMLQAAQEAVKHNSFFDALSMFSG